LKAQAQWLDKDLAGSTKPWKLVFFHKTPFYNKAFRANEAIKAAFCPILEKNHADIVFNGHDHGISRTYPIKNDRLYSRPSEGTVYYVTGRSGAKYYSDLTPKIWAAFFYDPQDEPCYEEVSVNKNRLTVTAKKQDGSVIDIYTINRDSDTEGTLTCAPAKFNATRVAVYGSLLGGSALNRPSAAKGTNGDWYVDAKAFMSYLGGSLLPLNDKLSLSLGTNTFEIPAEHWQRLKDGPSLSVSTIKNVLGYSCRYDESLNVLFFVK